MTNELDTENKSVPSARVHVRGEDQWEAVDMRDLVEGKTVVVFALPGAFTPTCSSSHLPRYEELYPLFERAGVDAIYCLSVNDSFVMEAWGREQGVERVRLIADGNAEFTRAIGMDVDKEDLGFGVRSWRYAMIVRDGMIEQMFVEPKQAGDPFEISDAETVLRALDSDAEIMPSVSVLTRPGCPHCRQAKALLDARQLPYDEIVLGRDASMSTLRALTGATSVPQIFIDGALVGGADALEAKLDATAA